MDIKQMEIEEVSNKNIYYSIIESLLFVAGEPLNIKDISSIIECDVKFTTYIIKDMIEKYENDDRGISIIAINDSYQLVTKQKNSNFVQKLLKINVRQSLSQASLETLAIIAYRQPITRIEIDEVRGVKSDRAINNLIEKGLIKECGRKEVAGRPILFSITDEFLKAFGLKSVKEMPGIEELLVKYEKVLNNSEDTNENKE